MKFDKKYEERLLHDIEEREQDIERIKTRLTQINNELRGYYTDCIRKMVKEHGNETDEAYVLDFPEDFESAEIPTIGNLVYDKTRIMLSEFRVDKETDEMFYTRYTMTFGENASSKAMFKFKDYNASNTILKKLQNHIISLFEAQE